MAVALHVAPKQLAGWQPRTFHHYETVDGRERLAYTVTESPWADPYEVALIDALLDYRANLHVCGRPLSESLLDLTKDAPEYVVGTQFCLACEELERHRANRAKGDEQIRKEGINPDVWRLDRVETLAEAKANHQAQQEAANRKGEPGEGLTES